jgi:hypothetical protein
MLYPEKNLADKGTIIGPESHVLGESPTLVPGYLAVQLQYRARGKQQLSDGTEISSSISVSNSGVPFTEVFSLPVPAGNYFYHQDDDVNERSILLFNTAHPPSLPISVFYETRGNKIKAKLFNIYNYGKDTFSGSGTITITHNFSDDVSDIIVLCQAKDGSAVSYEVDTEHKQVTLTGTPAIECSFLLIAVPES